MEIYSHIAVRENVRIHFYEKKSKKKVEFLCFEEISRKAKRSAV